MKNPVVDVTNCDREPIHIPGSVQSHGFLAAVNNKDATIRYASENVNTFTGLEAAQVLGQSFAWLMQEGKITSRSFTPSQITSYGQDTDFDAINPILVELNGEPYYMLLHSSGEDLVLAEFEYRYPTLEVDLQRMVGISVSRILEGKTVHDILYNTARQVREIIGYDRVMVYQFHEDGHGEVIAEDVAESVDSFMGLHYPASDIPKQARELYLTNITRIIVDTDAPVAPLFTYHVTNGKEPQPLDLTHSTLRSVSPIHIQYLKNMGVAASFSVSLVSHGKLWGLIACHNLTPKFIEYKARDASKLLGQILSSSLEYRYDEESKEAVRLYRQAVDELAKNMQREENLGEAFEKNKDVVLQITEATGAAVVFEDQVFTVGTTPGEKDIRGIVEWLKQNITSQIFHIENFSERNKSASQFTASASGMLACMLSKELGEYMLWFKPEQVRTVNWAGNPNKPVETDENGQQKISPRHSFSLWSQQMRNTSEPWSKAEISAVLKLREDIIYIINQKANQIRQLNERLKEAYDELDTFSFTISHDLKSPITSIRNYTEIILDDNNNLDEDIKRMLHRIMKSTDKMNLLIREVLAYSRISRKELQYEDISMRALVQEIVSELLIVYKNSPVEVVQKDLPDLKGDKTMIMQVFANVIGNAIKYSQGVTKPKVIIEGTANNTDILYKISDNGIGIDMMYGSQVFEIFKRLDNVKNIEGTGVGLSIVKRIMEKHNAKIWYESEVNKGTTFYLSFSNNVI